MSQNSPYITHVRNSAIASLFPYAAYAALLLVYLAWSGVSKPAECDRQCGCSKLSAFFYILLLIQVYKQPTVGPKVYEYYLPWALWIGTLMIRTPSWACLRFQACSRDPKIGLSLLIIGTPKQVPLRNLGLISRNP